jgi:hypothetical protein
MGIRRIGLALAAVALLAGLAAPANAAALSAGVYVNSNDFTSYCNASSTAPATSRAQALNGFANLGYSVTRDYYGASFTRSTFLSTFPSLWAVYVHSHGDTYFSGTWPAKNAAFRQDPGVGHCSTNSDLIYSSSIKAAAAPPYNIVIMSTCKLGQDGRVKKWTGPYSYVEMGYNLPENTMPQAFGFVMDSSMSYSQNESTPHFYLGYNYYTVDSSQVLFEARFWTYASVRDYTGLTHTLAQSFAYAKAFSDYENVWELVHPEEIVAYNPFSPVWYGNGSIK